MRQRLERWISDRVLKLTCTANDMLPLAKVSEAVDGRKYKRISVFIESFERGSAVGLGKIVEQQQARIEELSKRLSELKAARGDVQ